MSRTTTALRSLHDVGLAAWFGGGLMGAVSVNSTARRAENLSDRHRLASAGWERWSPYSNAAIGLHLAGSAGLALADRRTLRRDGRARSIAVAKTALTGGALWLTVLAERRADLVEAEVTAPEGSPQDPGTTPGQLGHAQDQLRILRWTVTALTGGVLVLGAVQARRSTQ
jgi:hypothetical protein